MKRFTIEKRRWYAMEYFHRDFHHHSPIYIYDLKLNHSGNSEFKLDFHHFSYSEGVQSKVYDLKTTLRNKFLLIAERSAYDEPVHERPVLIIFSLNTEWIIKNCPSIRWRNQATADAQEMMFEKCPNIGRRSS